MSEKEHNHVELIVQRGVAQYTDPEKRLETFLRNPKGTKARFVVKFGVDPTRPDIHIGHAVVLHKLRTLQDAGALVVFLIGDFTAMIGDPTGKSKVRPEISQQEVEANMKTYLEQVGKILDLSPEKFSWIRNSDWFASPTDIVPGPESKVEIDGKHVDPNSFVGKAALFAATRMQATHLKQAITHTISLTNFLSILRRITHARLIERDMFRDRISSQSELYLHEMMYPVLQAIDSHVIAKIYGSCDLEIGGSDQTFNMLMGREVMHMTGQPPQAVMAMDLLEGTDGKEKMSKSLGNYISIVDTPREIYGKVMSVPDVLMERYLLLATFTPQQEITSLVRDIEKGKKHPRDVKMFIARQLVAMYHGEKKAEEAEREFIEMFQEGGLPKDIQTTHTKKGVSIMDILLREGVFASKTVAKRYFAEGAIRVHGGEKVSNQDATITEETVLKIGKKQFLRIVVE
jgi:tyrosyl-tRNA synthetase